MGTVFRWPGAEIAIRIPGIEPRTVRREKGEISAGAQADFQFSTFIHPATLARMFTHRLRVTYRDVTAGDHVYHSRYLDWLEAARNEALREMGYPPRTLQERGILLPVVESAMKHHGMARFDDEVEIRTAVARLGGASVTFAYRVFRGGELLLEASTRLAVTNLDEQPVRMPRELREGLARHLAASAS